MERDKKSDEYAIGKASKNDITDEVKQENMGNRTRHKSLVRSSVNATDPLCINEEPVKTKVQNILIKSKEHFHCFATER